MISPRSQSESQYVPAQQHPHLPHVQMSANPHSMQSGEAPNSAGSSVMQSQMLYHQQPGSTSSSVSSALSQAPPPSHPGFYSNGNSSSNNYTTTANGQVQIGGMPSFSLPSVSAPPGMAPFFYEQNPLNVGHYPPHQQHQAPPAQSMYFQPGAYPLMAQPPPQGSHEQYFSLAPQAETSSSTTSLPTLTHTGSVQGISQSNDDKPFPGVLDPQYHPANQAPYHPRSQTYPTENSQLNKNSKRSSSSSSTSGPLGMTEETARRNRCSICNKQFKRPSSLQTHLYSHTGEKPFQCNWADCGRLFSVRSNMIRHRKLHERDSSLKDEKPELAQEQKMAGQLMPQRQEQATNQQMMSASNAQFAGMMPPLSWSH